MAVVAELIEEDATIAANDRDAGKPANDPDAGGPRRFAGLMDIGVLVGASVIFLIFIILLIRYVFPEGMRLGDSGSRDNSALLQTEQIGRVDVASESMRDFGSFVAKLADVRRDVKIRPADSIAWSSASEGATVHNRDAVQTFQNSRARVDFTTNNELRIGQNSLVVFRSGAADPFLESREAAAVVMSGELSGRINADYGVFALDFPAGVVELTADDQSGDAMDFRVGVNPDQSSTISILSGQADVNIDGVHYRVSAKQGLTIAQDGRTAGVRALPLSPVIHAPQDNAVARYLAAPPRIRFSWGPVPDAKNYRVEIAADPRFEEILVDELLNNAAFTHGNLSSGEYFWRISARDGWLQGPSSATHRLRIVRDDTPPILEVRPIQQLTAGRYVLRGRTAPQSTVYVSRQPVEISTAGEFEYFFNPGPGTHSVVVESIDAVGNVSYSSQVLQVPGSSGRSD